MANRLRENMRKKHEKEVFIKLQQLCLLSSLSNKQSMNHLTESVASLQGCIRIIPHFTPAPHRCHMTSRNFSGDRCLSKYKHLLTSLSTPEAQRTQQAATMK